MQMLKLKGVTCEFDNAKNPKSFSRFSRKIWLFPRLRKNCTEMIKADQYGIINGQLKPKQNLQIDYLYVKMMAYGDVVPLTVEE